MVVVVVVAVAECDRRERVVCIACVASILTTQIRAGADEPGELVTG